MRFEATPIRCIYNSENYKIYACDIDTAKYKNIKLNQYFNVTIVGDCGELTLNMLYDIDAEEKQGKYGFQYLIKSIKQQKPMSERGLREFLCGCGLSSQQVAEVVREYPNIIELVMNNETDKIIKAPVPKAALAHSYGSSSIIAHTIYQKYELKVPAYRQENDWQKLGLPIHRQDLINWHMKVTDYYFKPVYSLLKEILLTQAVLHADETSYRVLESDTQKTYYWTFLSGKQEKKPITFYHHDPHRSSQVATDFLGNYSGYLHCDMWQAYKQLPEATLVGCWAHVRRKFKEAVPPTTKGKSLSKQGVHYCNQMFTLEKSWENLSNEERHQKRQEKLKPLFDEFFKWCRTNQPLVLPGSKLGRAIAYALNHEDTFKNVLLDGKLVLSNNLAEQAIKTLVIGRKNWLFSQSFEGAQSSAIILSLIETAKRNNLDPEKYIEYLLDKLPNEENLTDQEHLSAYLPWTKEVQEKCKTRIEQRKAA